MCTKTVILRYSSPVRIHHMRAFLARTNSVSPMIFVGETTTRPSQVWNLNSLQCFYDIQTDPVLLWNVDRVTDPESIINTSAKMLGKMPVDVAADDGLWIGTIYCHEYLGLRLASGCHCN